MSLPKVSIDIVSSTTTSMDHNKQEFWTEVTKRMFNDNPLIYQLLAVTERVENKSEDFLEGYKRGACLIYACLLYTSPSPRDQRGSRMPSSA